MQLSFHGIPSIENKKPEEAVKILYEHCHETALKIIQMNEEIETLKRQMSQRR